MTTPTYVAGTAPRSLPIVGHVWQLMRRPLEFLSSLSEHGDLVEIRIGTTSAYVPCHPDVLREVLVNDRVYDKGGVFYERARDIAGNGLVTCPFGDHRRQRRLMQSAFQRSQLARYAPAMQAEIEGTTSRWRAGAVIDAFPQLFGMALRTVARTLYSVPVEDELVHRVEHAFEEVLSLLFRQMFLLPSVRRLPTRGNRRYRENLAFLHDAVQNLITEYRGEGIDHHDLLSALMSSREEDGGGLSDQEIHDQVITIMAAGTETVAATLTWVFHLLSQHPDVERRLYEEIDTVLGGRAPEWEDVARLELTDRIITETLRLYPPGWLFTRRIAADTELAGLRLKAGSTVVFSPSAVQRHRGAFPREDDFDPDRWLPEQTSNPARRAFVAFGTGARKCIGDIYARTECTLALATILSRWRVEVEPGADVRPVMLSTVYHPRKLELRLTPRATS
ncbi:MAG: cytochrome P450 [Actinophytocola sp.]|uniref:cytochrome P450 n=1 Tax=Actinophytocola sp. TaxID=1872138 RepID=UPI003C73DC88